MASAYRGLWLILVGWDWERDRIDQPLHFQLGAQLDERNHELPAIIGT